MKSRFKHHQSPAAFLVTKAGRAGHARPWTPRPAKAPKTPVPARKAQGEPNTPTAATCGNESKP